MRRLLRAPLTWMIVAEILVVGALLTLAWNVVAGSVRPAQAAPVVAATDSAATTDSPLPDVPVVTMPSHGPAPGLNVDSAFWRARLGQLNQDQAYFEQLEWHIVHTAAQAAERYVESVVLPAIQRAEREA